ncbi:hypothetical protein [Asticcacaulis sp. 201]|uniref:hypothetical protein n=1 Tax=Asticcacaulis sp. 201 TaxID=3028787 RepID=UPI002915FB9C|nr:hypothetical protein [Asticcacaulis sp. 201]MDV6329898.1 hypothetical protein [Asticcacaulis sp. 201]
MNRSLPVIAVAIAGALMGGCQSVAAAGSSEPATVNMDDAQTRAAVTAVLAKALRRAHVELGPGASAQTQTVSVLPPPPGPYETHSMAMPVLFDIVKAGGTCRAVRRDTQAAYDLSGVACTPTGR